MAGVLGNARSDPEIKFCSVAKRLYCKGERCNSFCDKDQDKGYEDETMIRSCKIVESIYEAAD